MKKKHDQTYLRDFICLDLALVSSYLEQLIGGVPQEAQVSHEQHAGGEVNVLSLFHVNLQGGRGYAENQTIYWARYARLEDELRKLGKLVELTASKPTDARILPHTLFIFNGGTLFEPDWSDWRAGVSLAKIIIDKLHQMNAIEALSQAQVDANGMVPMLLGPGGNPVLALQKDMLSQILPDSLPSEPPISIRRLFKPAGVRITFRVGSGKEQVRFEGVTVLQNFTPHRIDRCIAGPAQEDVHVLGLITEVKGDSVQFVPLAAFVKV